MHDKNQAYSSTAPELNTLIYQLSYIRKYNLTFRYKYLDCSVKLSRLQIYQ